jgi:hypothetical protein
MRILQRFTRNPFRTTSNLRVFCQTHNYKVRLYRMESFRNSYIVEVRTLSEMQFA